MISRGRRGWRVETVAALLCAWHLPMGAQALCPAPTERPILVVQRQDATVTACDLRALDRMPQKTVETRMPDILGVAGTNRWSGVPLSHIAAQLGAGPDADIQLVALNNYAVLVPMSDLRRFDPVLASRRNGELLRVREKGPLILVYPFDQHRNLGAQEYLNRSIWQVHEIRIR